MSPYMHINLCFDVQLAIEVRHGALAPHGVQCNLGPPELNDLSLSRVSRLVYPTCEREREKKMILTLLLLLEAAMTSVSSNVNEERIKVINFGRPCTFCNECTSRPLLNRIHSALYYATLSPSLSPSLCIYSCAHQRWRRSAPATAVAGAARQRLQSRKFST